MRFTDKVAIVTGAGNGIGLSIAHAFAAEGAQVVVADINVASILQDQTRIKVIMKYGDIIKNSLSIDL